MTPDEVDPLIARMTLLDYSRSKVSEHIGYMLAFFAVYFTLDNSKIFNSPLLMFFKIDAYLFLILFSGPLVYMGGRILYWTSFTTSIFRVRHFSKEESNESSQIDPDFEEYNLLMGYNSAAQRRVLRQTGYFGRKAKYFGSSSKLIQLTKVSIIIAVIYWLCLILQIPDKIMQVLCL